MNKKETTHCSPISEHCLFPNIRRVSGMMDNNTGGMTTPREDNDHVNKPSNAVNPTFSAVSSPIPLLVVQKHHTSRSSHPVTPSVHHYDDLRVPSSQTALLKVSPISISNTKGFTFDDDVVVIVESPKPTRRDAPRVVSPQVASASHMQTRVDDVVDVTPVKLFRPARTKVRSPARVTKTVSKRLRSKKKRPRRRKSAEPPPLKPPPQPYLTVSVDPLMDGAVRLGCLDVLSSLRQHDVFPFLFYCGSGNWSLIQTKTRQCQYKTLLEFEMDVSNALLTAMDRHHEIFSKQEAFCMMHELIHLFLNKMRWIKKTLEDNRHYHSHELVEKHYNDFLDKCSDLDLVERSMFQELDLGYMVPMAPPPAVVIEDNNDYEEDKVVETEMPTKRKRLMTRFSPLVRADRGFVDSMEDILEKENLEFNQDKPKESPEMPDWTEEEIMVLAQVGSFGDDDEEHEKKEAFSQDKDWDDMGLLDLPPIVSDEEDVCDFPDTELELEYYMEKLSTGDSEILHLVETDEPLLEEAVIELNERPNC